MILLVVNAKEIFIPVEDVEFCGNCRQNAYSNDAINAVGGRDVAVLV